MSYFQLLSNKEQVFNHDLPPGEADSRVAASLTEPMAKSKATIHRYPKIFYPIIIVGKGSKITLNYPFLAQRFHFTLSFRAKML